MKLSDAIREGTKQYPTQIHTGQYFDGLDGACALGCALAVELDYAAIWIAHPCINNGIAHPVTNTTCTIYSAVTDLNDNRGWTREAIADWLQEQGY